MFNADISKVPYLKIVIICFFLFSSIVAPYWFYFQFAPVIFKAHDLVKLLLLSSSVGVPLIVLNMTLSIVITGVSKHMREEEEEFFYTHLIVGCLFSIFVLYLPLLFTFFTHVSLKAAQAISGVAEMFFICVFFLGLLAKRKPSIKSS